MRSARKHTFGGGGGHSIVGFIELRIAQSRAQFTNLLLLNYLLDMFVMEKRAKLCGHLLTIIVWYSFSFLNYIAHHPVRLARFIRFSGFICEFTDCVFISN